MTKKAFQQLLENASEMTKTRLEKNPNYGVFIHASTQIDFIRNLVNRPNHTITEKERASIDLGLMAAKELEDSDPDYARVLEEVDYYFSKLE